MVRSHLLFKAACYMLTSWIISVNITLADYHLALNCVRAGFSFWFFFPNRIYHHQMKDIVLASISRYQIQRIPQSSSCTLHKIG